MIFKELIFEKVNVDKLYKTQMNGFADPSIPNYNLITFGSLFKEEFKQESLQKEFIQSYLKSAIILSEENEKLQEPGNGINKIFFAHSLTLPILYLCRHCVELEIKYAISRIGGKPKDVHPLEKIWSSFLSYLPQNDSVKEKNILKDMGRFVKNIHLLDDTGTKLRYSLDTNGKCTQDKALWVNSKLIVLMTEKFINQLELLDIDSIKSRS